ncbi:MAG: stage II sporulation protein M [Halanaerobium sp.]|nr:stage II sporulation protein M [Halanaerobium sp.]
MVVRRLRRSGGWLTGEDLPYLLFLTVIFIVGVFFGSLAIKSLGYQAREELVAYLSNFFQGIEGQGLFSMDTTSLVETLSYNLKTLLLLWLLGLSIIGMPLIPIIIFMKGFVIGFTVGFLVEELVMKGVVFALASVVPHNLILIPGFLLAGIFSLSFSFTVVKSLFMKRPINFLPGLFNFTAITMGLGLLLIAGGFIEAYVTPFFMELVIKYVV